MIELGTKKPFPYNGMQVSQEYPAAYIVIFPLLKVCIIVYTVQSCVNIGHLEPSFMNIELGSAVFISKRITGI